MADPPRRTRLRRSPRSPASVTTAASSPDALRPFGPWNLVVSVVVGLLVIAGLVVGIAGAAPATPSRLDAVLVGSFDGPDTTGVLSAVVSPAAVPGQPAPASLPVTLTAACTDATPCGGSGVTVFWEFGDHTTATTTSQTVGHTYSAPGIYHVTARITQNGATGQAALTVLVAPRTADVDADLVGQPAPKDRHAMWAVAAEAGIHTCRTALVQNGADTWLNPASTAVGRAELCPSPSAAYGPNPPPQLPAGTTTNGITGASCLSSYGNCNLPAEDFALGGNPTVSCSPTCEGRLVSAGHLAPGGDLAYSATNCGTGWTPAEQQGAWVLAQGSPEGCASRGEFFTLLTSLIDGTSANSPSLLHSPSSMCVDGPGSGTTGFAMERANALGIPVTVTAANGSSYCYPTAAITKQEAYVALAKVTGFSAPSSCPTTLRDLADATLGFGTASPNPDCTEIWSLLAAGVPVVGSTACPVGGGSCFNPSAPLTNQEMDTLFSDLLSVRSSTDSAMGLSFWASSTSVPTGTSVTLTAQIHASASYAPGSNITLTWPAAVSGVSTSTCPTTQTLTLSIFDTASATCTYSRSIAGTVALTATATDALNNKDSATTLLDVTQNAPTLVATSMPTSTQPAGASTTITASDPSGQPLTFTIESFLPDQPDVQAYPTGSEPTRVWTTSAATSVGTVALSNATATSVTATLSPGPTQSGPYAFAIRACDTTTCTATTISGSVTPSNVITTLAGTGTAGSGGDGGPATVATLTSPAGLAYDHSGDLYVADPGSNTVREVMANGSIRTVAGTGTSGTTGIGGPAVLAQLASPVAVAVDNSDALYISESAACQIVKVDPATGDLVVVAGNGTCGYAGDNGPATSAELNNPGGIAVDSSGNLFIADTGNCAVREVLASSGDIVTVAGTPGTCGAAGNGGPATSAELNGPTGISLDSSGNLFIADTGNCAVRELNISTGDLVTVAGTLGSCGSAGNGGPATSATLNAPQAVGVDSGGNLFIVDTGNCTVQEVTAATGDLSTIAGQSGTCGYGGDNGSPTSATLNEPRGLAMNGYGLPTIADTNNARVRQIQP